MIRLAMTAYFLGRVEENAEPISRGGLGSVTAATVTFLFFSSLTIRSMAFAALARSCCNGELVTTSLARSYNRSNEFVSVARMLRNSKVETSFRMGQLLFRQRMNVRCGETDRRPGFQLRQTSGGRLGGQLAPKRTALDAGDADHDRLSRGRQECPGHQRKPDRVADLQVANLAAKLDIIDAFPAAH